MRTVLSLLMSHRHRLMRRFFAMMGLLFALGFAFPVSADGISRLRSFMESTRSGQADFVQQVTSREGKTMTPLSGR